MKFTFNQSSMLKGLQLVTGAVSAKVPMPSLSNLHLKLNGNTLEVTATDLDTTITAKVELIEADGEGSVLIQARRFQDLIRELPDTVLEITIEGSGKIYLKGEGIGTYLLPGGDPVDFPELPIVDASNTFTIPAETLQRIVSKTIFAASHDDMRPILTGLLLQIRSDELTIVATDGHRLSRIKRDDISYQDDDLDVTVPMKALNLLMKNLSEDDTLTIGVAETRASFTTESQNLITRLIDGNYPKYEGVIPESNHSKMIVSLRDLTAAVRRVQIFASQMSRQIKISLEDSVLALESEDSDIGGRAEESVSVDYDGEPLQIAYNASYLIDVLKQIDTEEVIFNLGTQNDAAIIQPVTQAKSEDLLMLLMPIRMR